MSQTAIEPVDVVQTRLNAPLRHIFTLEKASADQPVERRSEVMMIQDIAVSALVQSWRNFASAFVLLWPRLVAATIIAGGFVVALAARRAIHRFLLSGSSRLLASQRRKRNAGRRDADGRNRRSRRLSPDCLIGFIVSAVDTPPAHAISRAGARVLPVCPALSRGAPRVHTLGSISNLMACHAAGGGERRPAGCIRVERRGVDSRDCHRRGHCLLGPGNRADGFACSTPGVAIAFGLGGRDAAKQLLEQKFKAGKDRDSDAAPHL